MTDRAKKRGLGSICRILSATILISAFASMSGPASSWTSAEAATKTDDKAKSTAVQITGKKPGLTADHTKFEILQKEFKSGPEVTKACLSCHTEASKQVHDSIHWKWEFENKESGETLGKRHVINAFCGNVASNEARCTSCHAGYGWKDMRKAPPKEPEAVDCLICHADKSTYSKFPTKAGHPIYEPTPWKGKTKQPPNLTKAAQSVSLPQRDNCGACHYYGGGGDGVKHGDIDSSLDNPSKDLDVHMAADGGNMACTACHSGSGHEWPGSRYEMEGKPQTKDADGKEIPTYKMRRMNETATCESCHSSEPHQGTTLEAIKLNNHTDTVACQTCHIPEFARGGVATKTLWDWSTAGKLKDGKPYTIKDDNGHPKYMSLKGTFKYEENVTPTYAWFNGKMDYTLDDDVIDPSKVTTLNKLKGDASDKTARIWPFKLMEAVQPYDAVSNKLAYSHLFGKDKNAFWKNFDWPKAIQAGMDYMGKDYSGKYDFAKTEMWWPITHMVAPSDKAVTCDECHSKDGRMKDIQGVFIPGRDNHGWIDWLGYGAILATLLGVLGHALMRLATRKNRQKS